MSLSPRLGLPTWSLNTTFPLHITKVVKNMFLDSETAKKLCCGCQKTTVIVKSATGLERSQCVVKHCQTSYFSLITDGSNDCSMMKNLVILVRHFDQDLSIYIYIYYTTLHTALPVHLHYLYIYVYRQCFNIPHTTL